MFLTCGRDLNFLILNFVLICLKPEILFSGGNRHHCRGKATAPAFLPPLTPLSLSFSSMLHVENSHTFSEREQEAADKGLFIPRSSLLRVSVSFCDIPESALRVKLRMCTDRALDVCYRVHTTTSVTLLFPALERCSGGRPHG